jgi:hypothetical protein
MLFGRRSFRGLLLSSISLASVHDLRNVLRQSEDGAGAWCGRRFVLNDPSSDLLFVLDDVPDGFKTFAPQARRVLVVTEPPDFRIYPERFLAQFGLVLSPFAFDTGDVPLVETQTGLSWWYGLALEGRTLRARLSLDQLRALRPGPKEATLSVVCSGKTSLAKHRARLVFLDFLKERMGDRLKLFGLGFEPVADKAQAIAPFQYHLVLENNDVGCFWTEKLADAYLGWSLPFFSGGPGVQSDFPDGSLVPIDIMDPEGALRVILSAMAAGEYEKRLPLISAARERVLEEHNMFVLFARHAERLPTGRLSSPKPLAQAFPARFMKRLRRKVRALWQARS